MGLVGVEPTNHRATIEGLAFNSTKSEGIMGDLCHKSSSGGG